MKSGYLIITVLCFSFFGSSITFSQPKDEFSDFYKVEKEQILKGADLSDYLKMDFGANKKLYVLDILNRHVFVFDSTLSLQNSFGEVGDEAGMFRNVSDILVDDESNIYVSDPYLKRVSKFTESGEFIGHIELANQAVEMTFFNDLLCTHTAGAIPENGKTTTCYDFETGEMVKTFSELSHTVEHVTLGTSNVSFSMFQVYENQLISLAHPFIGLVHVFDSSLNKHSELVIQNEVYNFPSFPEEYDALQDQPFDYLQTLIHGIHVFEGKILLVFVEKETGNKYIDIYNTEGERLVNNVIDIGKRLPIYHDKDGNLYAFSYTENQEEINLKKYKYIGDL